MQQAVELLAVITSGVYGVLLARRHHMDFVGVFSLALIVAFGGGTLRDLFLDRHPLFWIGRHHYTVIIFILALITSIFPALPKSTEGILHVPDSLGLGLFSIAGAVAALEAETSFFIASLMGVITGTFGGVIGDVVCNKVPSLFRPAPLCATCSFAGCWLLFSLTAVSVPNALAVPVSVVSIVVFRLVAIRWNWQLPQDPVGEHEND